MLKIVPVLLSGPQGAIETFAVLDDGSQRTMIMTTAVKRLGLQTKPDNVLLTTIRRESFTCKVESLQQQWQHLQVATLPEVNRATPLILVGSDHADLILPMQPIQFGPTGTPVAVCTKLGWSLQGPSPSSQGSSNPDRCLLTSTKPLLKGDLLENVARLWQIDVLPYTGKDVTRSKQDKQAITTLDSGTVKIDVDGETHYATPLLRKQADAQLSGTISDEKAEATSESWYIPHHVVKNNDKHRLVFNCSFEHNGESLNSNLLPGPTLGSSLLGVFLRFRQHAVAVTGDIKAMFHQIRLLPEDRPLLRFLWRDMKREETPIVYEWQVLPFGTTCSPCCATFALQKHVMDNIEGNEDVARCINQAFYVDNCLDSTPTVEEAQQLVSKTRSVLAKGGLNIRQWASNIPDVVKDLPPESRSDNCELWLNFGRTGETQEPTLGLRWQCDTDAITYRYRPIEYTELTMRVIYPTLATQYDPIGYLCPFTARAKILVQELWKGQTSWEKVITSGLVYEAWMKWEGELPQLPQIRLPGCYTPHNLNIDNSSVIRQLHIFCDASERIYGSVAYLRSEDVNGTTGVSFVAARSRVAPKKQLSIPRLELCAALTGAQLAEMLSKELTVSIDSVNLWSDSTTVLTWLLSDSCQYKVFVGTRVSEIQNLTDINNWRYVNTKDNPADDITCGKTLAELCGTSRWQSGPLFLCDKPERWPNPRPTSSAITEDTCELKKTFCLTATVEPMPEFLNYHTWDLLVTATMQLPDGAASSSSPCMSRRQQAEVKLYRQVQTDSFSEDLTALMAGKPVQSSSKLLQLDPEYDRIDGMIRVGGRLRQVDILPHSAKHPIVLDPKHHITRLIIKDYDEKLLHAGAERILAETRRFFWIIQGREAIRRQQRTCTECQTWRAKPNTPKRADLPLARLRLFRPSFFSTGVDCFGPMRIKIGRRNEKRWGILFKCMTSRAVNLDLLDSMDADSFLMAFRRFISHRGKPSELLSDCGTNFKGGETELLEAFNAMKPEMANQLEKQVKFQFNPPYAPHFGGAWEREIRSVKNGLKVTLGDQSVTEPVLRTVLIEIEGILNSKPLGYVPTDISDAEPVTPNVLLMGRRDPSLPQMPVASRTGRRDFPRYRWTDTQSESDGQRQGVSPDL
ncbi:uncharacterized protein LOC124259013 [Haliotis rubra]|uniref:uncharacterized protein LOC124259013 n=1 Tax=Haliotis rubra TaxID=36100 RepID=UPI001EE4F297|nr:uncharacterized protein LOC124259013 [Haliotis rubra]